MSEFKEYKRKPAKSRAFKFQGMVDIPDEVLIVRTEDIDTFQVWNALHSSWINFKVGDYIVGVPGDFYPHEEKLFEQAHEGFEGGEKR